MKHFGVLIVSNLLAILVANAQPQSVLAATNVSSYSGICAKQRTGYGVFTIKASPKGLRIESQNGAILIASPPDWTVYVFRKEQKKAARLSYQMFRTKNRFSVNVSTIKVRPRKVNVAGIPAVMYSVDLNQKLDDSATFSSLYRSKEKEKVVTRKELTFAVGQNVVPPQAKEIWRSYLESVIQEMIPLNTTLYLSDGDRRVFLETLSFRKASMNAADLTVPKGLNFTGEFVEMLYGKEMEGVADLLFDK